MYSFLELTMAFGQAVAPTVQISRRALTGSLPVLLLLAMAAAMMLATGPSTGQFHIPNLEKQSEQTYSREIVAEANKISAIVLNAKNYGPKRWSEDQKEGYRAALAKGDPGIPALILSIGVVTGLLTKNDAVQQSVVESLISSGFGEDANAVFPEVRTEMIEAANAVKKLTTGAKDWPKNYQEWFKGCLRKGDDEGGGWAVRGGGQEGRRSIGHGRWRYGRVGTWVGGVAARRCTHAVHAPDRWRRRSGPGSWRPSWRCHAARCARQRRRRAAPGRFEQLRRSGAWARAIRRRGRSGSRR